jgi:hypothetical protein
VVVGYESTQDATCHPQNGSAKPESDSDPVARAAKGLREAAQVAEANAKKEAASWRRLYYAARMGVKERWRRKMNVRRLGMTDHAGFGWVLLVLGLISHEAENGERVANKRVYSPTAGFTALRHLRPAAALAA